MTPLISVVIPVYNAARWLPEAIDSIRQQTLPDFELLLIDDGSSDQTSEILAGYAERDHRIRVLSQRHLGLVSALNAGLASARAPFVARLDADDRAHPQRLAKQLAFLEHNPAVGLLGSWAQRIDADGRRCGLIRPETRPDELKRLLLHANPFVHSTIMLRAELVRQVGSYRPAFEAAEDYDLLLRISEATCLANLAEPLIDYRRHTETMTARHRVRQCFSVRLAQRTAAIRQRTGLDPATNLATPPDWQHPDALLAFYAEIAATYRLLALADPRHVARPEDVDFAGLMPLIDELNHAERQLAAQAIINHLRRATASERVQIGRVLSRMVWRRPWAVASTVSDFVLRQTVSK